MKLKQALNRLFNNYLKGTIFINPAGNEVEIVSYNNNVAWFKDEVIEDKVNPVSIKWDDLLEWKISDKNKLISEGNFAWVDGRVYMLAKIEKAEIINIKEGDGSPFPFVVKFSNGGIGQYKRKEIKLISSEVKK